MQITMQQGYCTQVLMMFPYMTDMGTIVHNVWSAQGIIYLDQCQKFKSKSVLVEKASGAVFVYRNHDLPTKLKTLDNLKSF